jgi:hypothetical protein
MILPQEFKIEELSTETYSSITSLLVRIVEESLIRPKLPNTEKLER